MNKSLFIEETVDTINRFPENKAEEIADFAAFILKKYEEDLINPNVSQLISESASFEFLRDDEVVYILLDKKNYT